MAEQDLKQTPVGGGVEQDNANQTPPQTPPADQAGIPNDVFGADAPAQPAADGAAPATPAAPQAPATPSADVGAPQMDASVPDPMAEAAPVEKNDAPQGDPAAEATKPGKKDFKFKSSGLGSKAAKPKGASGKKATKSNAGKTQDQSQNIPRGALNAVVTRNEYYRDGYRSMLRLAIIEGIAIFILVACFIAYMNIHDEKVRYFATTADGRILQLVPLDQPNMTNSALMSWVAQAATDVMTFGFHDYQKRLQESSRHFTPSGWRSFTQALQRSRVIESVEQFQQVVTSAPRAAPTLLQEGIFGDRYRWVVQLPLSITFKSGSAEQTEVANLTLTIERVNTLENPIGVGIESWIAQ